MTGKRRITSNKSEALALEHKTKGYFGARSRTTTCRTYVRIFAVILLLCATSLFQTYIFGVGVVKTKYTDDDASYKKLMAEIVSYKTTYKRPPECLTKGSKDGDTGPMNVILFSLGRSGSSVTWQVLSNLTGVETPSTEYVGRRTREVTKFFGKEAPKHNGEKGKWLMKYMCGLRTKEFPNAKFVGFKWKSFWEPFAETVEAQRTLQLISSLASDTASVTMVDGSAPIRILRSRRNLLDVCLSKKKHENDYSGEYKAVNAHCMKGDEKCLNLHDTGLQEFSRKDEQCLHHYWKTENHLDQLLRDLNIPVEFVSYDVLYYPEKISDGEKEWNRALNFVTGRDDYNKTWPQIENGMKHVATTKSKSHIDIISNWEDVYERVKGTELEHFFRMS